MVACQQVCTSAGDTLSRYINEISWLLGQHIQSIAPHNNIVVVHVVVYADRSQCPYPPVSSVVYPPLSAVFRSSCRPQSPNVFGLLFCGFTASATMAVHPIFVSVRSCHHTLFIGPCVHFYIILVLRLVHRPCRHDRVRQQCTGALLLPSRKTPVSLCGII